MRRETLQEQRALAEGFAHQPHVELFQVAEAAVNQLAGARRRAGTEVSGLHQADGQASGDGVERDSRADHATADDQDLNFGAAQHLECGGAFGRTEPSRSAGRVAAGWRAVRGWLAGASATGPDADVSAASHLASPRLLPAGTP